MCVECFLSSLQRYKEAVQQYNSYLGQAHTIQVKIEIINGTIYNGEALLFLRKDYGADSKMSKPPIHIYKFSKSYSHWDNILSTLLFLVRCNWGWSCRLRLEKLPTSRNPLIEQFMYAGAHRICP